MMMMMLMLMIIGLKHGRSMENRELQGHAGIPDRQHRK